MSVIGIDARFYDEAGPGRYVKNIITFLEKIDTYNSYLIFLRKRGFQAYIPANPNFKKVLAEHTWYSFDEQIFFLLQLLKYKLDLFYVPHCNIPVLYPGKLVTAIPDIIMHTFSKQATTTLWKPYFQLKKIVYRMVVRIALLRSFKVIVPSNDVISDFLSVYRNIKREKFVLAYEGVDPDLMKAKSVVLEDVGSAERLLSEFGIKKPFLLYVGSMYPHKNVENLLLAFQILKEKFGFLGQLVLVGKKDRYSTKIYRQIGEEGLVLSVLMLGFKRYISDAEVTTLRSNALLYVFPSLKEGFSLTPLEGMAVSLPAVISKIPCHEEIYGDSVVYFDPTDPIDIAKKVNMTILDEALRNSLIAKGKELIQKYSFANTAEITLSVFKNALKS